MENGKNRDKISRRDFFKLMGAAGMAGAGLAACGANGREGQTSAGEIPAGQMTYRTNPKTGDKVSLLGFGMMRLPSVGGRSAREGNEAIDQEMVNRMVDYALEHGVNYFDTSPAYCRGGSERATGMALSRHSREKYFVATKLSNFAPSTWSREASIGMYRNSMKALQVDYIDYYLLHGIGMGTHGMEEFESRYIKNGVLDFLLEERAAGRIRNLGFSYHGDIRVFDRLLAEHDKYKWDFVQIQLNYLDWKYAKQINPRNTDAEYLYGELAKRGIPAVIMEPLLGGRLSNVANDVVAMLKQREPEASVASWAFRFAGNFPGVLTVLSGMTYGIDIPAILLHYNKCLNEGNIAESTQDEHYRRARRAYLVGYDRSVPRLRQASHCIGCNQCSPHCPQGIDIPAELHRIDAYVERLKQGV